MKRKLGLKVIKVLITFAMLMTIMPATSVKADSSITVTETETEVITTINSSNTGTGLNQFDFHGNWVYESSPSYTNLYMNDGHYVIPSSVQEAPDNYYEMTFEGNRIELYGNLEPVLGIMKVEIDDVDYGNFDLYHEDTKIYQQLIFDSGKLDTNDEHKIRVTLTGNKNPDASKNNGYIDFAKVYKAKSTVEACYTLEVGKEFQIPQVSLQDMSSVTWESSNPTVATVEDGLVQAMKIGTTVITASNETESAEIEIKVVKAIEADDKEYEFKKINDTVIGTGLEQFQYLGNGWGTDNNINALYQRNGHYVIVPANDNTQSRYYTMRFMGEKISIYGNKEPVLGIAEVYIDGQLYGMIDAYNKGGKIYQQLHFESPILSTDKEHELKVVWTGRKNENAQNQNGYVDFVEIVQKKTSIYPTEITLNETMSLEIGAEKKLDVQFVPANTNERDLIWHISDPTIVSVDETNTLIALKEGTVEIQAEGTDIDGNPVVSNVCTVTITEGNIYFHGSYGSTNKTYFLTDYDNLMSSPSVMSNSVSAWRKDRVYSEIVLLTKRTGFENLKVESTNFEDKDGNIIDANNIKPSFIKYNKSSPNSGTAGANAVMTPDIIYGDTMDVVKNTVQPIWVEMNIPEDSTAGEYSGKIRITKDGEELISFDQKIEVIDLVQPSITSKDSYYLELWNYVYSSARYYGVEFMSDKHIEILRPHLKQYVDNGGKTVMATIVEEPWNHQTYDDSPSMIKWTKKVDGTYTFDYTLFDRYAEFVLSEKIADTISCYSIVPWNNQIAYFDETSNTTVNKSMSVGSTDWTVAWTQFLEKFTAHLEEKGWYNNVWMAMDERGRADMLGAINLIKSIKNSKGEHFKISGAFNQVIPDIWAEMYHVSPNINNVFGYGLNRFRELADERRKEGLLTTVYTCTGNFPNVYNMSHPSEAAWTIWIAESMNTDGFMRWAYDSWVADPLNDGSHSRFETGDLQMVYPGDKELLEKGEIPLPRSTPRTERLYEAIRDVQKLRYLKEHNPSSADDITTFIRGVRNFNNGGKNETTRNAIDVEMDRMKAGVTNFSHMYINGNLSGNIAPDASVSGTDDDVERLNLIDGKLLSGWDADAIQEELKAEIHFTEMQDLSKLRVYLDKSADISGLEIAVFDEKERRVPVDWFEGVEGSSDIEKQYQAIEAEYIGYARAIEVTVKKGSMLSIQEVMAFAPDQSEIIKDNMSVVASSQETSAENGAASNMIDGNTSTIWHSRYSGTIARPPYTIDLDLGDSYQIDTFAMLPRQSGVNGIITKYDLLISETGEDGSYEDVVKDGAWAMDSTLKSVELNGVRARHVKLIVKEANLNFGSISELYIYQKIDPEDRNLQRAKQSVEKVKESLLVKDYEKALFYVSMLEDSKLKEQLQSELNALNMVDISILEDMIEKADDLVESDYTAASWETFTDVLNEALELLEQENLTQTQVNDMVDRLHTAIDGLELKVVETNKVALSIAIDMANAVTQEQLDKVVPAVFKEFKAALANANEVFGNAQATQTDVDNAFDRLSSVMQMLEFYKGDKALLQGLVDQIAKLTASKYTESTWAALQSVLTEVNDVLTSVDAMQPEVDEAYSNLVTVFLNLRLKPNKDLLEDLIKKADGLNAANYTASSWQSLENELTNARLVLNDPEATEQEVVNAKEALTKAFAGLVTNPSNPIDTNTGTLSVKSGDSKVNATKTGDTVRMMYPLAGLALASLVFYENKKRIK